VTFGSKTNENFKGVLTKLTELPETHEAFRYVISRKIPKNKYKKLTIGFELLGDRALQQELELDYNERN
jgi:hypothetical protein